METRQIAEEAGVNLEYVFRLLTRGILPRPARKVGVSYLWTAEEAAAAKKIIAERRARQVGRAATAAA